MKRLGLLVMPLMAVSLLASCGGSKPESTYTITFNCTDCKAFDESDNEVTSVKVPAVDPAHSLYKDFYFEENHPFKVPLKTNIFIKKTGTEETVKYKYVNGTISVPIVGDLTITAAGSSYAKDLEASSWAEIAEISATGKANEFFDVGDNKSVRLKGQSFDYTVRIIDFNHDDLVDGSGKAGITFEFTNLITNIHKSRAISTIWDGILDEFGDNFDYRQSVLNDFLNDEADDDSIINMLPDDLSKEGIIKPVNKLVGVNESKTEGENNYMSKPFEEGKYPKLFPLSYDEIHNPQDPYSTVTPGEAGDPTKGGGIYEYYEGHGEDTPEDNAYRVKKIVDGGDGDAYCFRSPNTAYGEYAWYCDSSGGLVNDAIVHGYTYGTAPAFCI